MDVHVSRKELKKAVKEWRHRTANQSAGDIYKMVKSGEEITKIQIRLAEVLEESLDTPMTSLIQKIKQESNSDDEGGAAANNFSAQTISLRAQKKLISKFASKKTVKLFIDDTSAHLFDGVYKLVQNYTGSKTKSHKIMKNVIKVNMKLILLYVHDLLNEDELNNSADLRDKFHVIAETCIRLRKPRCKITVEHLSNLFRECETMVLNIIARHLSDKSKQKVRESAEFFSNPDFLGAIFGQKPEYRAIMGSVCEDIQELLDRGII